MDAAFRGQLRDRRQRHRGQQPNRVYPSDDAPPYLTLLLVGHVLLPLMFWTDRAWTPALWVQFVVWLPLVALVSIATLPFMKGMVVGFAWAAGVTRETERQ